MLSPQDWAVLLLSLIGLGALAGFAAGLLGVGGGIAPETFGSAGDFEFNAGWKFDGDGFSVTGEDFDDHILGEPVFLVAEEIGGEVDHVIGDGVHEMAAIGIGVGELEFLAFGLDDIDFIAGGEADVLGFAGLEGADGGHDEGVAFAWGAVLDMEHDAGFALVFDGLTFFESGCGDCHGVMEIRVTRRAMSS